MVFTTRQKYTAAAAAAVVVVIIIIAFVSKSSSASPRGQPGTTAANKLDTTAGSACGHFGGQLATPPTFADGYCVALQADIGAGAPGPMGTVRHGHPAAMNRHGCRDYCNSQTGCDAYRHILGDRCDIYGDAVAVSKHLTPSAGPHSYETGFKPPA